MFELEVWQAPITDNQGNILPGAQITVFNSDDTVATIYDDLDRTPKANPFNVGTDALARFYAEPGRYRVQAQSGTDIAVYDNVDLSQKAHRDDLAEPDSEVLIAGRLAKDVASLRDDLGYAGSFESGFTITDKGQFAIFKGAEADGSYIFRWDGALPKEVPANSSPDTTGGVDVGAWVDVGQAALRSDLAEQFGSARIGNNTVTLSSIKELADIPAGQLRTDLQYSAASFWPGLNLGGGIHVWNPDRPKADHNGGAVIDPDKLSELGAIIDADPFGSYFTANTEGFGCFELINGLPTARRENEVGVFGAVASLDSFDNRKPIQACIEDAEQSGSVVSVPTNVDIYHIKTLDVDGNALKITNARNFKMIGNSRRNASITYSGVVDGEALLCIEQGASDWGLTLDSIGLDAGEKLNYALKAVDNFYANCTFNSCVFIRGKMHGLYGSFYMTKFLRCFANQNLVDGFHLRGPDSSGGPTSSTCTSISFDTCWARFNGRYGYNCDNQFIYSVLNSCGVDGFGSTGGAARTQVAYRFRNARGVMLNACGAEDCDQYALVENYDGFEIHSPLVLSLGPTTGTGFSAIELLSGFRATLSGFDRSFRNMSGFDHTLSVQPSGDERITILDNSLNSSDVFVGTTSNFQRYPDVIFWGDKSNSEAPNDRGKQRVGSRLMSKGIEMAPPNDAKHGQTTLISYKTIHDINSDATPRTVPIAIAATLANGGVRVKATITKFAGSPTPSQSFAILEGVAVITSSARFDGVMNVTSKTAESGISGNLVWSGNQLNFVYNAQWCIVELEIAFSSAGGFCDFI